MMHSKIVALVAVGVFSAESAFIGSNVSKLRASSMLAPTKQTSYGKDKCPCVGIDNLKGYYATQMEYYHVQLPLEAGASCEAWDDGKHPACRADPPASWCTQAWCYVDPCNCNIDVLPKKTKLGIKFQGSPAYWSYNTCGGMDFFSQDFATDEEEACVGQKKVEDCSKLSKCAWDGKQCLGKDQIQACDAAATKDVTVYGQDDCRCIGLDGREVGKAFMHVSEKELVTYPPNVGSTCQAWEEDHHPECKKDGAKPSWCSAKWCFVDPCKCKAAVPPKSVMGSNKVMRFQGKTAFWSYATCGSEDTWTDEHSGKYCVHHKTEASCVKVDEGRCAWDGKQCLGKALVDICKKQQETGILGYEDPLNSGAHSRGIAFALFLMIGAIAA